MTEPQQAEARVCASPPTDPRPLAPEGFEEFFRTSYRELVRTAMTAGASLEQAEDAASETLAEMLPKWPVRPYPLAWARRAVLSNFIKDKTRGNRRVAERLIQRGHVPRQEDMEDGRLTEWEDSQWVAGVLSFLPPAQREVMECIARGLDREEIAGKLGKSRDTVRQNFCYARARLAEILNPDGEARQPSPATARSSREEAR